MLRSDGLEVAGLLLILDCLQGLGGGSSLLTGPPVIVSPAELSEFTNSVEVNGADDTCVSL